MKSFLPPTSISRFLSTPKAPFSHILHFSTTPTPTEEIRNVKVSVWWDFENCSLPTNVNVFKVAQSITAAVRTNGINGPVSITAFGDVSTLSRDNQKAICDTGISLTHIPNGGKGSADRSLLVDLLYWVSQNPPPAHLFLITGDRDFASLLHRLRMSNYNILLASPDCAPGVLCSSASIMWQWSALVRGENLTGKYFNQPPDCPYASWYGTYKTPLADPFAVVGQPSTIRADVVSECGPNMLPSIPDTVMKGIRNILNSYPKGISAVDLRVELGKSNISIDKTFFGHGKFSKFLLAMPQILKLKPDTSGQYIVHGIPTKIYGENESTTRSSVGNLATKDEGWSSSNSVKRNDPKSSSKDWADVKAVQRLVSEPKVGGSPTKPPETMKVHDLPKPYTEGVKEKSLPYLSRMQMVETRKMQDPRKSQKLNEDAQETARLVQEASQVQMVGTPKMKDCRKSQDPSEHTQEKTRVAQVADVRKVTNSELLATDDHSSVSKLSVFEKFLKWWSRSENGPYNAKYRIEVDRTSGPQTNTKEKKKANFSGNSVATLDNSAPASSLFDKVESWFRSWRSLEESDDALSEKSQKPDTLRHILFSKDSFWNDIKSFHNTPKGSSLVLMAKTRLQLGQTFKRDGPRALASLSDDELLQLVDMLISDKKYVEESASPSSPFKLAEIAPHDAPDDDAYSSKLSNLVISDMQLQSSSVRGHKLNGEKICQKGPRAGLSQPAVQKLSSKSRSEILADVKNLVQSIVKSHPKGYNISLFEELFLDKFGYPLEFQNLGYTELGILLQIMPGVRIETGLVMPSGNGLHASGRKDLEGPSEKLSGELQKDEGSESPWEELGPLAAAVSDEKPTKLNAEETMKGQVQQHYELLSDDDLPDSSEDKTTLFKKKGGREKRKGSEVNSAFSKIIDSFYNSKEGSIRTSNSETVDSSDEYVDDATSAACRSRKSDETAMPVYGRQKRPADSCYLSPEDPQNVEYKLIDTLRSFVKPGPW